MKSVLLLLLTLASLGYPLEVAHNYYGYLDTIQMPACSSTVTVYGKKALSLTDFNKVRVIFQVDDTSSAGFASDSVNVKWGYQTYSFCLNSAGAVDTCFSPRVTVDTCAKAQFGTFTLQTLAATGIATVPTKCVDTSFCTGWAVQSRSFTPEFDVYMRFWMTGIAGNKTLAPIKAQFTVIRQVFTPVRSR
jgi:hypothetical protein